MKRNHILSILTCALVLLFAFSNVALAGGKSCSPLCKGKCPTVEKTAKASNVNATAVCSKHDAKSGQACSAACKETCKQKCGKECAENCKGCACKLTADGKMDCSKCTCEDCRAKAGAKSTSAAKASSCATKGCSSSCTKATKASASSK